VDDPAPLVFDRVVIDRAARRVLRDGVAQPLEPKAFAVLLLLAEAPGHAFTRDEILDAVWGHRHVTPGVLNRVMTLLRHALGEDAHTPRYIHTLHGVGYRFDLPVFPLPAPEPKAGTHDSDSDVVAGTTPPPGGFRRRTDDQRPPRLRWPKWWWMVAVLVVLAYAAWAMWPR
jgi:DNA-binding winged helix-turn-helix (wHTH) protein